MAKVKSLDCADFQKLIRSDQYNFSVIDQMGPSSRFLSLVDKELESIHTIAKFRDTIEPEAVQELVRMLNGQAKFRNHAVMDLSIDYIRDQMDARSVDVSGMSDADLRLFVEERLSEESFQIQVMDEIEYQLKTYFSED